MTCQLQEAYDATESLSSSDRVKIWWRKQRRYLLETLKKVLSDPMIIKRKLFAKLSGGSPGQSTEISSIGLAAEPRETAAPLNLKVGELVRVKTLDEIKKTLNSEGRTEGLGYMDVVMNKYCGGIYKVQKRINLFFEERRWRMMKVRNVLILEGVFCELPANVKEDWAGCDRTCFLFWKEAWLERLEPEVVESSATAGGKE